MRVKASLPELDKKLLNMILYFASLDRGRTSKVGFMKYLFYSDFTHFRDTGNPISTATYVKLPHGPCPDNWSLYLSRLEKLGLLRLVRRRFIQGDGGIGQAEYFELGKGVFNDEMFTEEEIVRMRRVYEALRDHTSTQLSKMSHEEVPYIEARDSAPIKYELAYHIDLLTEADDEQTPPEVVAAVDELERAGVL